MLEAIGLDRQSENVYRVILANPMIRPDELAARLGEPEAAISVTLDRLSALALINADEVGTVRAVRPEIGMEHLPAPHQAELAAKQQQIEVPRPAAAELIPERADLARGKDDPGAERLVGIEAIRERIGELTSRLASEIMTFAPGGAHLTSDLAAAKVVDEPMLERGIGMRTIWLDSIRNDGPTLQYATWLQSLGGQARTVPTLPVRMIIMDRKYAILPVDTTDAAAGAVVLHGQGTVAALCALFDTIWETGTPLGMSQPQNAEGLTPQETEFLRLLGQGHTDQAIAVRLCVSHSTAQRFAARLMKKLGARSRFEAGFKAAARGWLSAER
ncbi:LuxR C-terminal-related transcriptional regulator [Streptomyces sp. NPDC101149]|uniref:LuxR C-terminal-related transcriptional regulator n=1 Tax=Streptomyces sp. NPDC101149 TaxID=3366113 RepID=UPI00380C253D